MGMSTDRDAESWIEPDLRPSARDRRIREAELSAARKRSGRVRATREISTAVEMAATVRKTRVRLATTRRQIEELNGSSLDSLAQAVARFAQLEYQGSRTAGEHREYRLLESRLARAGVLAKKK